MVGKKDLLLTIIDNMPKIDNDPYHSIHTTTYLIDKILEKKYGQTTGFKFPDFTSLAGPYDPELRSHLEALQNLGLIDNPLSLKLTQFGKNYLANTGTKELSEAIGGKEGLKWLTIYVNEFLSQPNDAIEDAVLLWSKENPHKIKEISAYFPFLNETNC